MWKHKNKQKYETELNYFALCTEHAITQTYNTSEHSELF